MERRGPAGTLAALAGGVLLAAASLPCATLAYTYAFLAAGTAAIVPPVLLLAGGWRSLRAGGLG